MIGAILLTVALAAPGPPVKTLGVGAASKIVEIHEQRYWHGWNVPLRFSRCYRWRLNQVHCRVWAYLAVLRCERPHWEPYEDAVHLGQSDVVWVSTRFDQPLHLSIQSCHGRTR